MEFTEKEKEIIRIFKKHYIQLGYIYSGCLSSNTSIFLKEKQIIKKLFALVNKGILQKRNCSGLAFELVPKIRKRIILKNGLMKKWEKEAPYFYPNHPVYGEIPNVIKEVI